jgi:hypothetical protein
LRVPGSGFWVSGSGFWVAGLFFVISYLRFDVQGYAMFFVFPLDIAHGKHYFLFLISNLLSTLYPPSPFWNLEFELWNFILICCGFRVAGCGLRVLGSGFRVMGSEFGVCYLLFVI